VIDPWRGIGPRGERELLYEMLSPEERAAANGTAAYVETIFYFISKNTKTLPLTILYP
jgi:hypothetical protein